MAEEIETPEEIQPEETTPEAETPAPEETIPEVPEDNPNAKQAKEIFDRMPHIQTIWFDEKGAWRFYETPGSKAIDRPQPVTNITITDL